MERTELWSIRNQRGVPMWLAGLAAVLLLVRIGVVATAQKETPSKEASLVRWVPLPEAQKRSAASGKPMLYDFSAAWCGPCRDMDKKVFSDPVFAARINRTLIPVRVTDRQQEDGQNHPDVEALQRRYHINAFPTLVVADASGTEKKRMDGFMGAGAFDRFLNEALR